jgi:hypothetical protein
VRSSLVLLVATLAIAACGTAGDNGATPAQLPMKLTVSPQNNTLLVGLDRISIALLDSRQSPVSAHDVSVQVLDRASHVVVARPLDNIGPEYGGIPIYVGIVTFPSAGAFQYLVRGTTQSGQTVAGNAFVTVRVSGTEIPVGAKAPLVHQAILGDPGVTLAMIDSGVPPDNWHTLTIAGGVAQHRPMVLYFGDPAFCPSKTCGPTRDILQQLCTQYCSQLVFEHIETYFPAGPPGPTAQSNPAFDAFGLQTDPWVYLINAQGVVADRFEGPLTLAELVQSVQGTLAGKVPAVGLPA